MGGDLITDYRVRTKHFPYYYYYYYYYSNPKEKLLQTVCKMLQITAAK